MKQTGKQEFEMQVKVAMSTCVHFNGIQNEKCRAGITYRTLVGDHPAQGGILPCFGDKSKKVCLSREFLNREQAEDQVKYENERTLKTLKCVAAAHADAVKKGLKKGHGGQSEMDCPAGCGGKLKYTVAGVNGHMWAKCNTIGCVQWIE